MNKTKLSIGNKICIIYSDDNPKFILIQPTDQRELESLDREIAQIKNLTDTPFVLAAFEITDWNSEFPLGLLRLFSEKSLLVTVQAKNLITLKILLSPK